jgi:hypothetical protein
MDLRLYRPAGTADLRCTVHRLLGAIRYPTARNGYAEAGEKLFGLVFVDVH